MLGTFTCATFEPHLGTTFRLQVGTGDSREALLIEATPLPGTSPTGGRAPFSIVFLEPSGAVLPQRIYRMEHAEMGVFELFLVPIGPDAEGMRYEAVFT